MQRPPPAPGLRAGVRDRGWGCVPKGLAEMDMPLAAWATTRPSRVRVALREDEPALAAPRARESCTWAPCAAAVAAVVAVAAAAAQREDEGDVKSLTGLDLEARYPAAEREDYDEAAEAE